MRFFVLVTLLLTGCKTFQTLTRVPTPREDYINALDKSNLIHSTMAEAWIRAGEITGHDSVLVTLPFQETGYFAMSEAQARFYRFDVKDGQVLTLTCVIKSKQRTDLFYRSVYAIR